MDTTSKNPHDRNVDELSTSLQRFGLADYAMFVIMLVMCSLIGVYFGFKDHQKKKKNKLLQRRGSEAVDYLMGGKSMKIFPVAMSLTASFISGITLLGAATEVYLYGTQYCYTVLVILSMGIALYFVTIPVFHDLQITSTYEYLELRFNRKIRLFGSLMFTLATVLFLVRHFYLCLTKVILINDKISLLASQLSFMFLL